MKSNLDTFERQDKGESIKEKTAVHFKSTIKMKNHKTLRRVYSQIAVVCKFSFNTIDLKLFLVLLIRERHEVPISGHSIEYTQGNTWA